MRHPQWTEPEARRSLDKRFYHIVRQPAVTKVTDAVNCIKLSDHHAPARRRTFWIESQLPPMKVLP
jgi:hypothetical protein